MSHATHPLGFDPAHPTYDPARLYRTTDPALRILGSRSTLAKWRYEGIGPNFIQFGRLILYRGWDLDNFMGPLTGTANPGSGSTRTACSATRSSTRPTPGRSSSTAAPTTPNGRTDTRRPLSPSRRTYASRTAGWLRLNRHGGNPYPNGRLVQAVVKREGNRWYATVCYPIPEPPQERNGHAIAVDRNVGRVADSDAEIHRMPDLSRHDAKLRQHKRALSRKRKGSKRRASARRKVTRAARRLANARKAWQHRTSRKLAGKAGTVVIEKLNTKGMSRSAKGTHTGQARQERARQSRPQPRHPEHRLDRDGADALLQGGGADPRTGRLHLQRMRRGRRRLAPLAGKFPVRGLRPCTERGPERGPQHPGVGGWRICTGRGAFTLVTPTTREVDIKEDHVST